MKFWRKSLWQGWLLALAVSFLSSVSAEEITMSAAASLTDALVDIGRAYETGGGSKVLFNFGASSELARQIDEGAPVDLFFSADLEKMDTLDRKGRVERASRRNLLSNRLVVAAFKDSKRTLVSPADLLGADIRRVAVAEPSSVPAGIYARKYLQQERLWEPLRRKIIPVANVRAVLAAVESGNVDAGFVYKTDAAISQQVKIVYEVPVEHGPKIVYPVAVMKESRRKTEAQEFLTYLRSDGARNIFQRYGFIVLDPAPGGEK